VTAGMPNFTQNGSLARAISLPVARRIAEKGGVIGIWPDGYTYGNLELMADAVARLAADLEPAHVGIGTDMNGLIRTVMPSYAEYAQLEEMLARRGMKAAEIEGILGGNYLRVLREAMKT
jgi:membrane dipeptidase